MKKNLVLIMGDQLRYDVLRKGFTPHIDSLMSDSVVFDRAYSTSAVCVPARGSLMTGTYPSFNGAIVNPWDQLDKRNGITRQNFENLITKMETCFDSIHCGKQHFFTEPENLEDRIDGQTRFKALERDFEAYAYKEGFKTQGGMEFKIQIPEMVDGRRTVIRTFTGSKTDRFSGSLDQCFDGYVLNNTIEEIRNYDRAKPLFLSVMFLSPHPPLNPPEPYYSMVKDSDFEMPANVGVTGKYQSPLSFYGFSGMAGVDKSRQDWLEPWRVYLGLVRMLDDCVGTIINELKEQGLYDDSLIIFTSDHGEMLGSHRMWQKMNLYEESIRVPLSFKFPLEDQIGHQRVDQFVSSIDVFPTVCDYYGLEINNEINGLSLMDAIRCQTDIPRESIFAQYDGNTGISNQMRCIIHDNMKLITSYFKDEFFIELYDLNNDAQEMNNLVFDRGNRNVIQRLLSLLQHHMQHVGDYLEIPADAYDKFLEDYESLCTQS